MTDGNIIYASESVTSLLEHLPVSIIRITNEHFYVANPLCASMDDHPHDRICTKDNSNLNLSSRIVC